MFTYFIVKSRKLLFSSKINSPFLKCINFFWIILFISIISAWAFWNQGILTTFVSSYFFFGFFLYYYLHKKNYTVKDIECGFLYASIVFIALFAICHLVYPLRIVRGFGEVQGIVDTSRGMSRIRLTLMGAAPIYFSFFYFIKKLQEQYSTKLLFVVCLLFAIIIMQLGRFSIALSFALGALLYFKNVDFIKKFFACVLCIGILFLLVEYIPIINTMINLTQNQLSEGDEYIRSLAYEFYLNNVSPNIFTDIFGNGQYSLGKSPLGDYVDTFGRAYGLIPADVGYAYIFLNFGYLGWLFWGTILLFVLFAKIPSSYVYIKYYVVFLYISNFMGNTLMGGIQLLVFSIYIIDRLNTVQRWRKSKYYM